MLSRSTYKGCKIEFYPDECDVPLPARVQPQKAPTQHSAGKKNIVTNRFDLLDINSDTEHSDTENSAARDTDTDAETLDDKS